MLNNLLIDLFIEFTIIIKVSVHFLQLLDYQVVLFNEGLH